MKCRLCEERLLEYLYGELGEEQAAAMARHLEASEACRRVYEGYASVLETVADADEEGPASALHTRIMGHAEEARPERRSFRAWMFRPAVTTAVIGAVAAGIYFTTLRHKPPSYLEERLLSEQSPVRKSEQRQTPPSPAVEVDSFKKEAKDKGLLSGLAPPSAGIEQEGAASEPMERVPSPPHETRALPMALSATPARDLAAGKAQTPQTISQALHLASEGQCKEAGEMVETYTTVHSEDEASGAGWLEVARCFAKKGDTAAARETAERALEIQACVREARAFLDSLPPPAE